jgi:hypothetical protein
MAGDLKYFLAIIPIRYNKYNFDTSDINTDDRPLRRSVQLQN